MQFKPMLCAAIAFASPATASQDYALPEKRNHRLEATCQGERIIVIYTTQGSETELGLNQISVEGRAIASTQLQIIKGLIGKQPVAGLQILGCRRGSDGGIRHWLQVDPALSQENVDDPLRSKWFYIENGEVSTTR